MTLHDHRPRKEPPTHWFTINELKVGEYYYCRLAKRVVRVTYVGTGAKATYWSEFLGMVEYAVANQQLCAA